MAFFDFLLILVLVVVPVVAMCTQAIPLRSGDVTFRDTDPEHAWGLVAQYAQGTFEQRFGYPTGYFSVDEKRSERPRRVLIREVQPSGAITDGCSAQVGAASLSGFDEGCGPGCLAFMVIIFIGSPFILVSMFDRFFRLVLRSRVDVGLRESGNDTVASFAFYGPGGYSLRRRYGQVFEKPALPAVVQPAAPPAAATGRHAAGSAA
jgi:hypothetical protein